MIVTTPQDIALLDARKGLKMFEKVEVPVLGIVENMSGFICPHCDKPVDIFGTGGGKKVSLEYSLRFLGKVPMDPKVVMGGDSGKPYLSSGAGTVATKAFDKVLDNVTKDLPVKKES